MKYTITQLNRDVELDDTIIKEYLKYDDLTEYNFVIAIMYKYGHIPTKEEASNEELSQICNEVLLSNLKMFADLPKIFATIEHNLNKIKRAAQKGELLSIPIEIGLEVSNIRKESLFAQRNNS